MTTLALRSKPIVFTAAEAATALARAKKSRNDNSVPLEKVYYYEVYRRILAENRFLLCVQNNNLTASEYKAFKLSLNKAGFTVSAVRNALMGAAFLDHCADALGPSNATPPQSYHKRTIQDEATKRLVTRFKRMLVGPSLMIFSNASHTERPFLMADAVKALSPESITSSVAKKIIVAGALVDFKHALSREQLEAAAKNPSMQRLREELVGLLSSPGSQLVGVLQTTPQALVRTLSGRE
ncbi:hypothetical protein HDU81_004709 [Chytriomyces hyalinus]|nr:hypothetical protein HDU81_004709 [Chytriomyces hyalinus]